MPPERRCPSCQSLLPPEATESLCRGCLLALALQIPGPTQAADASPAEPPRPEILHYFGDYELTEEIARGGMGVVYKARQVSLNRTVALKMLLSGPFSSPEFKKRFRTEAESAARLQHPNIVAIHEVGEHDGHPYLSMDFVDGPTLGQMTKSAPLPARMAAQYVRTIAEAIHHAHEQGILHRDLKPSNVLIDGMDEPRVTDFGLAKELREEGGLGEAASMTISAHTVGSPGYLPPEQAAPKRGKVSRQSDVYGLGATLYHLLTGRPPFAGETVAQTLAQVIETEPPGVRLLNASVPRDLETICLKCLEKEPSRRYATARLLAEDLGRYLEHRPVEARPVTGAEKAWRWCLRNRKLAGALGALAVVLVAGVVGITWQWRRAEGESLTARRNQYTADMLQAQQALAENDYARAYQLLEDHRPASGAVDLRGWEWGYLKGLCRDDPSYVLGTHTNSVRTVGVLPGGRTVFSGGWDGKVKLWDLASRSLLAELPHSRPVWGGVASPDGRWRAASALTHDQDGRESLKFWDLSSRRELAPIQTNAWLRPGQSFAFSPDSNWLAFADHNDEARPLIVVALPSGEEVARVPMTRTMLGPQGVAFSQDGRTVAVGANLVGDIALIDTHNWREVARLRGHTRNVNALAAVPGSQRLASISADRSVRVWDLREQRQVAVRDGLPDDTWSLAVAPDGETLAFGMNSIVQVVRAADLSSVAELRWLPRGAQSLQYLSPHEILVGGGDGAVKVFDLGVKRQAHERVRLRAGVAENMHGRSACGPSSTLSPDGGHFLTIFTNGTFSIWETASLNEHGPYRLPVAEFSCAAIANGGDLLAFADQDGFALLWSASTKESRPFARPGKAGYGSMRFSDDGRQLVFTESLEFTVWDVASARLTHRLKYPYFDLLFGVRFTADGQRVVGSAGSGDMLVWDLNDRGRMLRLDGLAIMAPVVTITADGTRLIAAHGETRFWDLRTGRLEKVLPPVYGEARCVALSPDGRRLAMGMANGTVSVIESTTFREVARFRAFDDRVYQIAFTPDGKGLFAATPESLQVWRSEP